VTVVNYPYNHIERLYMPNARGFSTSVDFDVHAEIESTQDYITLEVTADYSVDVDDPEYDPRSGNSLTSSWIPTTSVELTDVSVGWADDTADLGDILEKNNITGDFTLLFSCDHDEGFKDDKDERPGITVSASAIELLDSYKADITDICNSFAEELDVDVSE